MKTMTVEEYVVAHPGRRVTINAEHLPGGLGVHVIFEELRGPYRPITLGEFKAENFVEAVKKMDAIDRKTRGA